MVSWQLFEIFSKFFKEHCYTKKKQCYKKRGSDVYRKSNYATFYLTSPRFLYFSIVHSNNGLCIYRFISWKKLLKVVNNTPTIGLWRSLTCQNFHDSVSPLMLMTDSIDIYALLPENASFLECFYWPHIYFIRHYNNPIKLFLWGIFEKS